MSSWGVRAKLLAAFAGVTLFILIMGIVGHQSLGVLHRIIGEGFGVYLPSIDYLVEADRDLQQALVAERSMVSTPLEDPTFKVFKETFVANRGQAWTRMNKYRKLVLTDIERKHFQTFDKDWKIWSATTDQVLQGLASTDAALRQAAQQLSYGDAASQFEAVRDTMDQLQEQLLKNADYAHQNANDQYAGVLLRMVGVTVVAVLLAIGLALVISRNLLQILGNEPILLARLAQRVADGDLSAAGSGRKAPKGSVQRAMAEMVTGLREMIELIQQQSNEGQASAKTLSDISTTMQSRMDETTQNACVVESSAQQVSESNQVIEGVTEQTAQGLSEIAATMKDMDETMNSISASSEEASTSLNTVVAASEEASSSMSSVASAAERSNSNVRNMAHSVLGLGGAIEAIQTRCEQANADSNSANTQAQETARRVEQLDAMTNEISKVVGMINNIAEQTNMLALNASIESAGAGEAGKGFAVVANEVKELAGQTSESVKMITDTVANIQAETSNVTKDSLQVATTIQNVSSAIEEIVDEVLTFQGTLEDVSRTMEETSTETAEVSSQVVEASQAITEIAHNITEVSTGIGAVNQSVARVSTGITDTTGRVQAAEGGGQQVRDQVADSVDLFAEISQRIGDMRKSVRTVESLGKEVHDQADTLCQGNKKMVDLLSHFQM
ncbi:methyl-accepting chemotaxis protein [Magnetococcus sp. PR-3]|uniref:methyl-accepting chemotaxis protein n=1 Tax=Magnetococcus sp. PR-3 TaxID=3120355 RepID=UPI002FCE0736